MISVGDANFIGSIYAPETDIEFVGDMYVHGSIFANNLSGTGDLVIEYDTDVSAPEACVDLL